MSLFENSRGVTIWDMQNMVNHRQVQRTKERVLFLQGKDGSRDCFEQNSIGGEQEFRVVVASRWLSCSSFSLAELLLGKKKIFLLSAGVCKVSFPCWGM